MGLDPGLIDEICRIEGFTDDDEGQVQESHVRRSKTRQFKNPPCGGDELYGEKSELGVVQNHANSLEDRGNTVHSFAAHEGEQQFPLDRPGLVDLLAGLELLEHLEGGLSQVLRNHEKFAAGFLLLGGRPKDSLSLAPQDAGPQLRAAELHHQRGRGGRRGRRGRVADAVAGQDSVVDGRSCLEEPVAGSHIQDRAQNSLEHSGVEISRVSRFLLIFRKRKARDPDGSTAEKLLVRVENGLQRQNFPVD